jgi:anti-sigma B factor antagonist
VNISTHVVAGGMARLSVGGEIDMDTAGELDATMSEVVTRSDVTKLVVDFAEVTFCDSSGIAALGRAYAAAAERGIGFQLVNLQPNVRWALEITGVLEGLTLSDD